MALRLCVAKKAARKSRKRSWRNNMKEREARGPGMDWWIDGVTASLFGFTPGSELFCLRVQHRRGWALVFGAHLPRSNYTPYFWEMGAPESLAAFRPAPKNIREHPAACAGKFLGINQFDEMQGKEAEFSSLPWKPVRTTGSSEHKGWPESLTLNFVFLPSGRGQPMCYVEPGAQKVDMPKEGGHN